MAAPPDLQQTLERLATTLATSGVRVVRALAEDARETRRRKRQERRALKRQEQRENASVIGGVFGLVLALVMVGFAVTNLQYWWLLFVALGVGSGGARQLSLVAERNRGQQPQKKHELRAGAARGGRAV